MEAPCIALTLLYDKMLGGKAYYMGFLSQWHPTLMHKKRATSDTQLQLWSVDFDDLSLLGSEGRVHYPLAEFVSQFFWLSACGVLSPIVKWGHSAQMSSRKWMCDTFFESFCRLDPRSRSAAFESIPFKSYEASKFKSFEAFKFKSYARSSFLKGIESRSPDMYAISMFSMKFS